jgi:hypothetical protein
MQYLVSFALLVAFIAWMAGVYHQLEHLRAAVCLCWGQWCRATHHRNECLADFAETFALFLPEEDPRPAYLRRLAADSDRSLALVQAPRWSEVHGFLGGAEQVLRKAVACSVQTVEDSPAMREHEHLQRLCSSVSVSLYQQDQLASLFNHAAVEYNAALAAPSARLLAPLFGFVAADPLDVSEKEHPQA